MRMSRPFRTAWNRSAPSTTSAPRSGWERDRVPTIEFAAGGGDFVSRKNSGRPPPLRRNSLRLPAAQRPTRGERHGSVPHAARTPARHEQRRGKPSGAANRTRPRRCRVGRQQVPVARRMVLDDPLAVLPRHQPRRARNSCRRDVRTTPGRGARDTKRGRGSGVRDVLAGDASERDGRGQISRGGRRIGERLGAPCPCPPSPDATR
jgi:hypothetical protein